MRIKHQHPYFCARSLQVVAELSLSFGYNISFGDPEGADQPEEKIEKVMSVPDTYKNYWLGKALSGESRTVMMEN